MVEHAPTPWQIGIALYPYVHFYGPSDKAGGALAVGACVTALGKEYDEANAAFIVKAVNNHEALVSALTDARNAIASLPMESLGYASDPMGEQIHWPIRDELLHRINEALAGVVGESAS